VENFEPCPDATLSEYGREQGFCGLTSLKDEIKNKPLRRKRLQDNSTHSDTSPTTKITPIQNQPTKASNEKYVSTPLKVFPKPTDHNGRILEVGDSIKHITTGETLVIEALKIDDQGRWSDCFIRPNSLWMDIEECWFVELC
jgi:hypothetical protein